MSGALAPLDVAGRVPRLRERLAETGVEALLVTKLVNLGYLTGYTGSAGVLLVASDAVVLFTDGRYRKQAGDELAAAGVDARLEIAPTGGTPREALAAAVGEVGIGHLGLEAAAATWAQQRAYSEWFEGVELVATEGLVEGLREVKDAGEVARIAAACGIADEAFAAVKKQLHGEPTEREFALVLEFAMRERGASATSFDTIVASGPNGARPHLRPTDRHIGRGELVVCDFGCVVDRYCSDMTRTVSVGDPGPDARHLYDVVRESQAAARAAVRAGVAAADVDRAARAVIEAAGWGEQFAHGTGHGVGLEIHEAPRLAATSSATLAAGSIVTVEPGVYLEGRGGVRIEDTVVVTETGADALTATPKELVL